MAMLRLNCVPFSDANVLDLISRIRQLRRNIPTFVYSNTNMIRNIIFPNINNEVARVRNAIRSFFVIVSLVKNVKSSIRASTSLDS